MTSTSTNSGYSLSRNSSKVIQPPGGRTADIFGRQPYEPESVAPTPAAEAAEAPIPAPAPIETEPVEIPTPAESGEESPAQQPTQQLEPATDEPKTGAAGQPTNEVHTSKKHFEQQRRNPITGEVLSNPAGNQPVPARVRQPPGGHSSGIF